VLGPGFALLSVVTVGLGLVALLAPPWGLVVAVVALGAGVGLRAAPRPDLRSVAPIPPLAGLGALAVYAPVNALTGLFAGLAGLGYLVWLADDPDRLSGGFVRGLRGLTIPALALAIAWVSSLWLPYVTSSLGIAVALLTLVLVAVALLLRSPARFDRDPAATS
jgi:hypothetical protein